MRTPFCKPPPHSSGMSCGFCFWHSLCSILGKPAKWMELLRCDWNPGFCTILLSVAIAFSQKSQTLAQALSPLGWTCCRCFRGVQRRPMSWLLLTPLCGFNAANPRIQPKSAQVERPYPNSQSSCKNSNGSWMEPWNFLAGTLAIKM